MVPRVLTVHMPRLLMNGTHSRVLTSMESCILSRTLLEAVFQKFRFLIEILPPLSHHLSDS